MWISGLEENKRPTAYIGCGQCWHTCPQHIDVPTALARLVQMYEKRPHWDEMVEPRQKLMQEDLQ